METRRNSGAGPKGRKSKPDGAQNEPGAGSQGITLSFQSREKMSLTFPHIEQAFTLMQPRPIRTILRAKGIFSIRQHLNLLVPTRSSRAASRSLSPELRP